jgi:hypothetical protein
LKDVERGKLLGDGLGKGFGGKDPFAQDEDGEERREEKVGDFLEGEERVEEVEKVEEEVKVVVIGDRQFTDILMAHRLRLALPPSIPTTGGSKQDRVISILTTHLPQPNDVIPLRWLEKALSRSKLRKGSEDWGKFVYTAPEAVVVPKKIVRLGWNPKKWTIKGLVYTSARGLRGVYRVSRRGVMWVVARIRREKGENVSVGTAEEFTKGAIAQGSSQGVWARLSRGLGWVISLIRRRKVVKGGESVSIKTAERLTSGAS